MKNFIALLLHFFKNQTINKYKLLHNYMTRVAISANLAE